MHVVLLSVPVDEATQVSDVLVTTLPGNELTLSEKDVDTLVSDDVPKRVNVGLELQAIFVF